MATSPEELDVSSDDIIQELRESHSRQQRELDVQWNKVESTITKLKLNLKDAIDKLRTANGRIQPLEIQVEELTQDKKDLSEQLEDFKLRYELNNKALSAVMEVNGQLNRDLAAKDVNFIQHRKDATRKVPSDDGVGTPACKHTANSRYSKENEIKPVTLEDIIAEEDKETAELRSKVDEQIKHITAYNRPFRRLCDRIKSSDTARGESSMTASNKDKQQNMNSVEHDLQDESMTEECQVFCSSLLDDLEKTTWKMLQDRYQHLVDIEFADISFANDADLLDMGWIRVKLENDDYEQFSEFKCDIEGILNKIILSRSYDEAYVDKALRTAFLYNLRIPEWPCVPACSEEEADLSTTKATPRDKMTSRKRKRVVIDDDYSESSGSEYEPSNESN